MIQYFLAGILVLVAIEGKSQKYTAIEASRYANVLVECDSLKSVLLERVDTTVVGISKERYAEILRARFTGKDVELSSGEEEALIAIRSRIQTQEGYLESACNDVALRYELPVKRFRYLDSLYRSDRQFKSEVNQVLLEKARQDK